MASGALLSVNYDEWQMGAFVVWRQPVNPTVCTNHSQTNHFVYHCSTRLCFSREETPSPHSLPNARVERRIIPQQRPPQDHLHDDIGVMAIWKVSDSKRIRSWRNHIVRMKWKLNGNLKQRQELPHGSKMSYTFCLSSQMSRNLPLSSSSLSKYHHLDWVSMAVY